MSFGARALGSVAIALAAVVMTSCGGGSANEPGAPRLTLTDSNCAYDGDETFSSPSDFVAEVVNESSTSGGFQIARISPGFTAADVETHFESEQQRIENGLEIIGQPTYLTLGARVQIEPGVTGALISTLSPGTWVLWCEQGYPPTALFLIEPPLEVS